MRVTRTLVAVATAGIAAALLTATPASADSTTSLAVSADTFTASSSPSSNYGSSQSLGVYGTPDVTALCAWSSPRRRTVRA